MCYYINVLVGEGPVRPNSILDGVLRRKASINKKLFIFFKGFFVYSFSNS